MATTSHASGTETVSTTEWSLTTDTAGPDSDTTAGGFQAWIDLNALADGDVFEFRVYETINANQRCCDLITFRDARTGIPGWYSPAYTLRVGWDMTLVKVSGTDRAIAWHINKVA